MRIKIFMIGAVVLLLIGCTDKDEQFQNDNGPETNQERYTPSDDQSNPMTQNTRNKQRNQSHFDDDKDIFTNEASEKIQDMLNNRQDIRNSQVAITDTRALIAVQLSKNADRENILDSIENDIKHIVPKKELVIYTEDSYYDRMKNLGSQLKRLTDHDDIDKFIDDYFKE